MRTTLLLTLLLSAHTALAGVLPTPAQNSTTKGAFRLTHNTTISHDASLATLANYIGEYLGIEIDSTNTNNESLVLRLNSGYTPEGYTLRILPSRIEIEAGDYGGIFNGIQTLFQLLPPEIYKKNVQLPISLACRVITDKPRFSYRGMMLDVARTWIEPNAIMRYIDLLSYHKINKLHLHLTDDEGWRIEIKSHPDLTQIGGFRGGDSPIRPVYGKWGQKYGGYFTQDQMRELIHYASARNIEIIPEIDLPGHSRNIARVHPEILCRYTPNTDASNGYDERSAWCVARKENYKLLEDILGELCELFPSKYIHIGGDEVDISQWKQCPDCRALMQQKGLTDARQLQDIFMKRMVSILSKHGKLPGVWNESVRSGDFTQNSRTYGWESVKACIEATGKGYKTVVMPGAYFYFDMRQTPREAGHNWAAIFDAKKVYGFSFEGFTPQHMNHVEGLSGSFFSEAYTSHSPEKPDYLDYMCFPRICALSEIAWHGNKEGWVSFYNNLQSSHYDRLAAMNVQFRLFPPKIDFTKGKLTATTTDSDAHIYYIKTGSNEEYRYMSPIATDAPHEYLFRTRYKTGKSFKVGHESYYRTITPSVTLTSSIEEGKNPFANVEKYKTFARTKRACRKGDWILYRFAEPLRCRTIYLQTGHKHLPKTIVTTGYAEVSYDGVTFERAGDLKLGSIALHPTRTIKAVRIISTAGDNGCSFVTIQPPQIYPQL